MSRIAARAEQFYSRSGNQSTKGSRRGFSLLGGGDCVLAYLTPEEQRDSLVQKVKSLEARIAAAKQLGYPSMVKELGQEKFETTEAIRAMRPALRSSRDVFQHFADICRETMTRPQFNMIMDEANRRLRTANDEVREASK